jgi:Domain of unknown function (DUF4911)
VKSAGIEPIFLRVDPRDIAMAKFVFESYEGVGIVRTLDRRRAVIVVLAVSDFFPTAREIVDSLREQIEIEELPPPPEAGDDWLLGALDEEG